MLKFSENLHELIAIENSQVFFSAFIFRFFFKVSSNHSTHLSLREGKFKSSRDDVTLAVAVSIHRVVFTFGVFSD